MKNLILIIIICLGILAISSCKKFIEIDPPRTELIKSTVFASDATANAAMAAVYSEMKSGGFASGDPGSIGYLASLSSDESIDVASGQDAQAFNHNSIAADNSLLLNLWSSAYKTLYNCNAIIEGVAQSTSISTGLKAQLEGEAKFIRAFSHFYLVNLFGDIPLAITTDYKINAEQTRTPVAAVYQQIIKDLKDAQNLLPVDYSFASNLRVRANKGAATSLLSRVYLYNEEWANAEIESSKVIENKTLYDLEPDLELVYRGMGKEAILQLWSNEYPKDRNNFAVFFFGPIAGVLRPEFAESFDPKDKRWMAWGLKENVDNIDYYGLMKYYDFSEPPLDYSTILRLAEQYLIRAEARAKLGKLKGANSAESDINIIRSRAGLAGTQAESQSDFLLAIENERKWELCGEWGHRWLDLKRTNRSSVMLTPIKGVEWNLTDVLYPIPSNQIINSRIPQNPGY